MKIKILLITLIFLNVSCNRLNELKWDVNPEQWLETHSYTSIDINGSEIILAEPSSSIIVFLLGFALIVAGVMVLKKDRELKQIRLWGIGLIIWALSTFFAGISYQIFSYMLKCYGREVSLWTTWWEIWYLLTFVISQNMIIAGTAIDSLNNKAAQGFKLYTIINTLIYISTLLIWAFIPHKFLTSFEYMVLFIGPTFLILTIFNFLGIKGEKSVKNKIYTKLWIGMFIIILLYFGMLISPLPANLWDVGIWFNANDTLHVGLIIWVLSFIFNINALYNQRGYNNS